MSELQTKARNEKRHMAPESAEWHKKTGEILGYDKVIASVMIRAEAELRNPKVS